LIEVLIVVVIMAVLAATIIPQFSSSTTDAKKSTLKFNAHTMRSQIELYKVHHGVYPTIIANSLPQLTGQTMSDGTLNAGASDPVTYPWGPYMDEIPANPFNNGLNTVKAGSGVADVDNSTGWLYDVNTGAVYANCAEGFQ
jgi:type II secretory pathway pseudopilin PulG